MLLAHVCKMHSICMYPCVHLPTLACLPEALDGTLFADVAFGLVLGWLCSSHTVEDRQPNHRLGLQAHPLQEVRHLNRRFPWGLEKEGGREERSAGDSKQSKYRPTAWQVYKVMRGESVLPFQRWSSSELLLKKGIKENTKDRRRRERVKEDVPHCGISSAFMQQLK